MIDGMIFSSSLILFLEIILYFLKKLEIILHYNIIHFQQNNLIGPLKIYLFLYILYIIFYYDILFTNL